MSGSLLGTVAGVASVAFPPAAPIIGAAAAIADALGVGDWLTKHLFGNQGTAVAQAVVNVASGFTGGSTDHAAIVGLAPDKQAELRVQLANIALAQAQAEFAAQQAARDAETARMNAAIDDMKNARQTTVDLAKMGSSLAWGAPMISGIVLMSFGVLGYVVLTQAVPAGSEPLAMGLVETLKLLSVSIIGYWCGSSAGSDAKDKYIANSVPPGVQPSGPFVGGARP